MLPDPRSMLKPKELEEKMKQMRALMEGDLMTLFKMFRVHEKIEVMVEPVKHRGKERLGIFLSKVEESEDEPSKNHAEAERPS